MRGVCSIDSCEMRIYKHTRITRKVIPIPTKIHESFEGLEGINICWHCGDKIIQAIEKELKVRKSELWQDLTEEERIEVIAKNIKDLNNYK